MIGHRLLEPVERTLDAVDSGQSALVEEGRRHDHHREVDHARDRHRDHHIDLLEAEDAPPLVGVPPHDPPLGQRGVQVDDVRHHGRADDPRGQQHALGAAEARHQQVAGHIARVGAGIEDLERE